MPSAIGTPREAALADHCGRLVFMKYRIDDFMDTLWQRYGADDSVLESHGIDWLEEVAQDAAMNDNPAVRDFFWPLVRNPEFYSLECVNYFNRYALDPWHFVRRVLPAAVYEGYHSADLVLQDIDPSLVIGGMYYRNYSEDLSEDKLEQLNERVRESSSGPEHATYLQLGALPLYIADEGKNRVRAFLKARKPISAFTTSIPLPSAGALILHEISRSSAVTIANFSTGGSWQLPLPAVTVPLLESYGVEWGPRFLLDATYTRELERQRRDSLVKLVKGYMIP
jgi:hypothetical protein